MNNEIHVEFGLNRTGGKVSPSDAAKSKEGAESLTQPSGGDSTAIAENRIFYMKEADPVGSVPLQENLQKKLTTENHAFMDKLGERLAFERTGTRLYEALLSKYNGTDNKLVLPELHRLEQFYLEELKHFQLVHECILKVGGDPTSMTPSADMSGMTAVGWIKGISDPRTTFLQSLEVILQVELVDNAGWELLIELAESVGLSDMAILFQQALDEESFHLTSVKQWVLDLTINEKVIEKDDFQVVTDITDQIKH